ncbi:MAG TPA: alpha/beta fold hydrolase [Polyangiales bacterium]|nr:alpha/beta fold hydrolase [Polyangiales bacterium]
MALRPLSLVLLALALIPVTGCKVLGMRTIPTEMLEEEYEKPNSRYVEIDGTKLHYTIEGKGPPVLLLHGVLASLHTWDSWVPLLRESFTVIRFDIPGFGLSESFADDDKYTPEYAAEFVEKARKKLGYDKLHIVGNSLGGFIAWYYATKYPERVDKLILIDPASYPQDLPFIIGLAANRLFGAAAQLTSPRFIVKRNLRKVYGNPDAVTDETIDRYHSLLLRDGHRHAMVQYCRVLEKYAETEELVAHIPEIKAKTMLMWGEKDRWVPPELIERWKQDLPEIEVRTYPEGGHIPMEEIGEETARDAYAFLSDGAEPPDEEPAAKKAADDPEAGESAASSKPAPSDAQGSGGEAPEEAAPKSSKPNIGWDDEE